jgi:hypothetical protein
VAGEHHPGRQAEVRPREHGVADPLHFEAAEAAQRLLDRVGQRRLRARDRRRVDQRPREREDVGGEVERRESGHDSRA